MNTTTQTSYKEVFQLAQDKGYRGCIVSDGNNCAFIDRNAEDMKAGDTAFSIDDCIGFYKVSESDVNYANLNHWKVTSGALDETTVLAHLQKWLREEHRIFVEVVIMQPNAYAFTIYSTDEGEELASYKLYSDTYEQALLEGISEGLKLI